MIFWLLVIGLFIGIGLWIIGTIGWDSIKHRWLYYHEDYLSIIGGVVTVTLSIVLFFTGCFIFAEYNEAQANLAVLRERETALTYKLESGSCRDEFGLLSKSVIDEIQNWNEDIVRKKNLQNNFWCGIFYADIYDSFETIDYTHYKTEENG